LHRLIYKLVSYMIGTIYLIDRHDYSLNLPKTLIRLIEFHILVRYIEDIGLVRM